MPEFRIVHVGDGTTVAESIAKKFTGSKYNLLVELVDLRRKTSSVNIGSSSPRATTPTATMVASTADVSVLLVTPAMVGYLGFLSEDERIPLASHMTSNQAPTAVALSCFVPVQEVQSQIRLTFSSMRFNWRYLDVGESRESFHQCMMELVSMIEDVHDDMPVPTLKRYQLLPDKPVLAGDTVYILLEKQLVASSTIQQSLDVKFEDGSVIKANQIADYLYHFDAPESSASSKTFEVFTSEAQTIGVDAIRYKDKLQVFRDLLQDVLKQANISKQQQSTDSSRQKPKIISRQHSATTIHQHQPPTAISRHHSTTNICHLQATSDRLSPETLESPTIEFPQLDPKICPSDDFQTLLTDWLKQFHRDNTDKTTSAAMSQELPLILYLSAKYNLLPFGHTLSNLGSQDGIQPGIDRSSHYTSPSDYENVSESGTTEQEETQSVSSGSDDDLLSGDYCIPDDIIDYYSVSQQNSFTELDYENIRLRKTSTASAVITRTNPHRTDKEPLSRSCPPVCCSTHKRRVVNIAVDEEESIYDVPRTREDEVLPPPPALQAESPPSPLPVISPLSMSSSSSSSAEQLKKSFKSSPLWSSISSKLSLRKPGKSKRHNTKL